jgi:hypothetical protein
MNPLNLDDVYSFVDTHIIQFHEKRLAFLKNANLNKLIQHKNPYLFRAKNVVLAQDYISNILDSFLASQEETMFGDFLEALAIFIASKIYDGYKSTFAGVDLEFIKSDTHYLVQIKSGINWGNSSQHKQLATDFENAKHHIFAQNPHLTIQPVIASCYGKRKTSTTKTGILKLCGQSFWHFISDDPLLYIKIIEPLGREAKKYNSDFDKARAGLINTLTTLFVQRFCLPDGAIHWEKLLQLNSQNLDIPN